MKQLISDNILISKSVTDIESELNIKYGSVIRWAIVDVFDDNYKISLTYEK